MKILALDTTSDYTSVAFLEDENIIFERSILAPQMHLKTMFPMIEEIFEKEKITAKDIDFFAVATGPGSFTGIRIGVSVVEGLAFALNTPCIGISSLKGFAKNLSYTDKTILSVVDARREEFFNAFFQYDQNTNEIMRVSDEKISGYDELEADIEKINDKILIVGSDAEMCYNILGKKNMDIELADKSLLHANAVSTALLGREEFLKTEDKSKFTPYNLKPIYIRRSQAEEEREKRINNHI